jgi:NAD(P)-dependent dehydrogenase (short-subunit alcohol dehydrogenase family)
MRFVEQVALITAAASGIGRATAEIIGGEHGIVVGVDTDQSRLEAAMAAIRDAGGRAHARRADALDPAPRPRSTSSPSPSGSGSSASTSTGRSSAVTRWRRS